MLTLESKLRIPSHVYLTEIESDIVLLNARTSKYYALKEVGARFCELLKKTPQIGQVVHNLLSEYDVAAAELETDILELAEKLLEHNLVEIVHD